MCVIKIISQKEMYGFEVIETLSTMLEVTDNTVYPLLRRLTEQGVFSTYVVPQGLTPPRKYYRITDEGKVKLEAMVKDWRKFLTNVVTIIGGETNEK
jgi:PadR family transcriptional regulator PadR